MNSVATYRKELGLKAILAVKQISLTKPNKEHKKYSYKHRGLDISRSKQVWSTDITYIKINGRMIYLAIVIDWLLEGCFIAQDLKYDELCIGHESIVSYVKVLWKA